ncbi:MAG: hypothetical protein E6J08_05800 [Chloroflexi bacterium]|nr:MAG: hypothetical protein E6J08_05800 [Chloroflexota bacterium]
MTRYPALILALAWSAALAAAVVLIPSQPGIAALAIAAALPLLALALFLTSFELRPWPAPPL